MASGKPGICSLPHWRARHGGICLINLSHKSASCRGGMWKGRLGAAPPLYICQGVQEERVKENKLVPKGMPFTSGAPPFTRRAPPHSHAQCDSQVLAGLFHFARSIASAHKCFMSYSAPQSACKRFIVRRIAHFAQQWTCFLYTFPLIVCLFNDMVQDIIPVIEFLTTSFFFFFWAWWWCVFL